MMRKKNLGLLASAALVMFGAVACFAAPADASASPVTPKTMPRVGTIDPRFQSYNIEMVEVTGGRFWRPYASKAEVKQPEANQPSGMDPSLFEYRQPINLYNARLRKLAAALGPVYVRVSGTWANTTFFQNSDDPAPNTPPAGFKSVLTRQQWKGVVDFANAVNAKIVTSVAVSPGTRNAEGVWTPDQAQQIFAYTKSIGGSIAAAEFMNEPTMPETGGAPKGYDAAAFGRDIVAFRAFAKHDAPGMLVLGPGGVGEGSALASMAIFTGIMKTEDILSVTGPAFDGFSYHTYGGVSARCKSVGLAATTTAEAALSDEWLSRGEKSEQFYGALRDRFEPGKPMWNTETAQTACGGDRWASTFLDSFRYLNQLGSLAKRGVQVHMHNTLAASDYGLLDEKTYEPRPNYWAALLWSKFMGTTVLDPGASPASSLHLYAQCLPNHPGGVTLLAINASKDEAQSLGIATAAERYTLTAKDMMDKQVELNGLELKLGADDALPELKGEAPHSGKIVFAPASITFLALPDAHNPSCQQ
ncbi:MAG TPA: hypothetical protein VM554_14145 [Acidisarcina sp.]|nr:hypothetical protein [Acidisarcina sp.]